MYHLTDHDHLGAEESNKYEAGQTPQVPEDQIYGKNDSCRNVAILIRYEAQYHADQKQQHA